jgi:hypothetical protein
MSLLKIVKEDITELNGNCKENKGKRNFIKIDSIHLKKKSRPAQYISITLIYTSNLEILVYNSSQFWNQAEINS